MSIGIMDADISTYLLVPFNLEAMKLSAYYKNKNQIVVLAPDFTPERHQKFFYIKDYNDGKFPRDLGRTSNLEYHGLAFSNNIYKPLPIDIEKAKPDPTLYEKMERRIRSTKTAARDKIYQNMMTSEHCRLSLDGKTIWPDYPYQFKALRSARNLMFHDFDLGAVEGSYEEICRILSRARTDGWATRVGMKFPVQIYTGQELLNWTSLKTNSTFFYIRYNGVIDNDCFMEWVGRASERAAYATVEYNVTLPSYEENDFLQNKLPQIFKQIIFSRTHRVVFSLKYEQGFFTDPFWGRVIELLNFYHTSLMNQAISSYIQVIADDTLYDFAKHTIDEKAKSFYARYFTRQEIREVFNFVRQNHPELFNLFYNCSFNSMGGTL